jgi:membrane protease YdiL (CAAX protease family)
MNKQDFSKQIDSDTLQEDTNLSKQQQQQQPIEPKNDFPTNRSEEKEEQHKSRLFCRMTLSLTILYSGIFEIGGALIGVLVLIIISSLQLIPVVGDEIDTESIGYIIFLLVNNALASILVGALALIFNKKAQFIPPKQQLGLTQQDGKLLLGAFCMILFSVAGIDLIGSLIQVNFFPNINIDSPYDFFSIKNLGVLLTAMVLVSVVAPITEEIFYRWTVIETLKTGSKKWTSILLSAIIFALAHSSSNIRSSFYFFVVHLISTLFMGIILGYVYYRTRKVINTIILHALWNFLISLGAIFDYANIGFVFNIIYFVLIGLGAIGSIITLVLFLQQRKKKEADVSTDSIKQEEIQTNETSSKNKRSIKLKKEWFGLILGYYFLVTIIPWLISLITGYLNQGQDYALVLYLGMLIAIGVAVLFKLNNQYSKFHPEKKEKQYYYYDNTLLPNDNERKKKK